MDEHFKSRTEDLIKRMRASANSVHSFSPAGNVQKLTDAVVDLRQGANTIEDLLKIIEQLEDDPGLS